VKRNGEVQTSTTVKARKWWVTITGWGVRLKKLDGKGGHGGGVGQKVKTFREKRARSQPAGVGREKKTSTCKKPSKKRGGCRNNGEGLYQGVARPWLAQMLKYKEYFQPQSKKEKKLEREGGAQWDGPTPRNVKKKSKRVLTHEKKGGERGKCQGTKGLGHRGKCRV